MSGREKNPTIYVNGLSSNVREKDLEEKFSKYGDIKKIQIKNGFAFIEYFDYKDADYACEKMDGKPFDGKKLTVQISIGPRRRDNDSDRERERDRDRDRERDRGRGDRRDRDDYKERDSDRYRDKDRYRERERDFDRDRGDRDRYRDNYYRERDFGRDRDRGDSRDRRRFDPDRRKGPQPHDVCFNCNGKGHWSNECEQPKRQR